MFKVRRFDHTIMSVSFVLVSLYNLLVITGVVPWQYARMANIIVIMCMAVTGIRSLVLPMMNPEKVYAIAFRESGIGGKTLYIVYVFMTALWLTTNIILYILIKRSIDVSAAF